MAETVTLYLVRHAVAEERGEAYPDDTKRPLTPQGMARFKEAARGLAELGVTLDLILTSPLVRARQTAEILASTLPGRIPIEETDALAPGSTHASVVSTLAEHSRRTRIALVGHEPGIGQLAARLVGSRAPFAFKKGAVCCVEVGALPPAGPGALLWFATPRMLRALAS